MNDQRIRSAVVLALLAACSAADPKPPVSPPRPDYPAAIPPTATAPAPDLGLANVRGGILPTGAADAMMTIGAAPMLTMVHTGENPRRTLGYALRRGTSQRARLGIRTATGMTMGGEALPTQRRPRIAVELSVALGAAGSNGSSDVEVQVQSVVAEPAGAQEEQLARALESSLASLAGTALSGRVSTLTGITGLRPNPQKPLPLPARGILDELSRALATTVVPLPQEPVGSGAVWQVRSRFLEHGWDTVENATYTLALQGDKASIDVAVVEYLASPLVRSDQMPAGMTLEVLSFESRGSRTIAPDVTGPIPLAFRSEHRMRGQVVTPLPGDAGTANESTIERTTRADLDRF